MRLPIALALAVSSILALQPTLASSSDAIPETATTAEAPTVQSLLRLLQQQNARIEALEHQLAAQAPPATPASAAAASVPAVTAPSAVAGNGNLLSGHFGSDGFTLQTGDGANAIHFRGNLSVDGRDFSDAYTPATADTFILRRVRPTMEGTLQNIVDFRLMPDFAQGKTIIQDAWIDARIKPWFVITAGKYKAPVGLERLQLEQFARFIEVGLPSDLLPYRDLGVDVGGTVHNGLLSYAAGVFDGTLDGGSTDGNSSSDLNSTGKFSWEGRVFSRPFVNADMEVLRGLGVGVAATYVSDAGIATATTTNTLLASYKSPGQQSMFSYRANTSPAGSFNNATVAAGIERRLNPQFFYYYRSLGLLGEYVRETQQVQRAVAVGSERVATLEHSAWQIQAAYFLTGEQEAYDRARPLHDFHSGAPGAGGWELVARYHEIRFDPQTFAGGAQSFANPLTSVMAAHAIGTGINWYLNPNVKLQLDYELTRYENGLATGDRPAERALISQFALVY